MKPVHPSYPEATITCACGHVVVTRSTRGSFNVEICSNCHPFYTGRQKLTDSAGRVERFRRRYAKVQAADKTAEKAAPPKAE